MSPGIAPAASAMAAASASDRPGNQIRRSYFYKTIRHSYKEEAVACKQAHILSHTHTHTQASVSGMPGHQIHRLCVYKMISHSYGEAAVACKQAHIHTYTQILSHTHAHTHTHILSHTHTNIHTHKSVGI